MTGLNIKTALMTAAAAPVLTIALASQAQAGGAAPRAEADAPDTGAIILPRYGDINPFYGDINPFWGDINPFYGDISPFWGDISPFWGDISPFYGDISAFWGDISPFYGDISPFWGDISAFWGNIGPFWGDISAFWGDISAFSDADYMALASELSDMYAQADAVFGPSIEAVTGQSFEDGFLADLNARFGIDLNDPESLADVSAEQRAQYFLAFYDGLMGFSGRDHVDHWMPAINWTPALAQAHGGGQGVRVGLVDFALPERIGGLSGAGNGSDYLNFNHGLAVANLIGADHDGEGVMGVAPNVRMWLSNPFDESLTANWTDVRQSVAGLVWFSDIVNLSLGLPGWTFNDGWADVLSHRSVRRYSQDTVFVFAAGNDGVTQSANVDWSAVGAVDNLLIVGSVNPAGEISIFSNRPGEACLTTGGVCAEGARLMDRFLVAPGELIFMPDGEGGYTRLSGTSFAAPLVSGAAALVKGEWSWLNGGDVAEVLLSTAQDLGAPGVDPVYGHGLLDVGAAMAPINPDALYFGFRNGYRLPASELGLLLSRFGFRDDLSITVFEDLRDTVRDFQFTLAELTLQADAGDASAQIASQSYAVDRAARLTGANFRQTDRVSSTLDVRGSLTVTAFAAPIDMGQAVGDGDLPFQTGIAIANAETGFVVRFGHGEGALALSDQSGFGLATDYRPTSGGVNPLLGYASGGPYAMAGFALGADTQLSIAASTTRDAYAFQNPLTGEETAIFDSLEAYAASAITLDLRHQAAPGVSLQAAYTHLSEADALLGAQGLGALSFNGGSQTSAITVGADVAMGASSLLSVSATAARTGATGFDRSALSLPEAAVSTAFQVSASRQGVFGDHDSVRLSLIQPLHVENGLVEYQGLQIIDRETGALGAESQQWALDPERRLAAEAIYAFDAPSQPLAVSVFARIEGPGADFTGRSADWAGGLRAQLRF